LAITYRAGNRLVSPDSSLVNDTTGWSASGSYITVDTSNNELDFTYSGSANHYSNFDLGVITSDNWVLRFKYEIKTYTGLDSGYLQLAFGVVSAASNSISGTVDGILLVNTVQSSLNRYRLYTLNNTKISGGSPTANVTLTKTSAVQTLYVEIERKGNMARIRLFTNSDYSGLTEEVTGSCAGTGNLRYIQGAIYDEGSAMTYTSSISKVQFFDSEPRLTADGTNENGTTYTDVYSGKEHILNYGQWAETNQPSGSIAELLNDHSSVRKQHMWDWFTGSNFSNFASRGWTTTVTSSATVTMQDTVDGGLAITTSATAGSGGMIDLNNIRQFAHDSSILIGVIQRNANLWTQFGFTANTGTFSTDWAGVQNWSSSTYVEVRSADASTASNTNTDISVNTNTSCVKVELSSSNIVVNIDGILKATKTTNRPTVKMQPAYRVFSETTNAAKIGSIRYIEAYNT